MLLALLCAQTACLPSRGASPGVPPSQPSQAIPPRAGAPRPSRIVGPRTPARAEREPSDHALLARCPRAHAGKPQRAAPPAHPRFPISFRPRCARDVALARALRPSPPPGTLLLGAAHRPTLLQWHCVCRSVRACGWTAAADAGGPSSERARARAKGGTTGVCVLIWCAVYVVCPVGIGIGGDLAGGGDVLSRETETRTRPRALAGGLSRVHSAVCTYVRAMHAVGRSGRASLSNDVHSIASCPRRFDVASRSRLRPRGGDGFAARACENGDHLYCSTDGRTDRQSERVLWHYSASRRGRSG